MHRKSSLSPSCSHEAHQVKTARVFVAPSPLPHVLSHEAYRVQMARVSVAPSALPHGSVMADVVGGCYSWLHKRRGLRHARGFTSVASCPWRVRGYRRAEVPVHIQDRVINQPSTAAPSSSPRSPAARLNELKQTPRMPQLIQCQCIVVQLCMWHGECAGLPSELGLYAGYLFHSGSTPQVFVPEGHQSRQRKLHLHGCIFNFG